MTDYETYELGDVVLQSATRLRRAELAYKTSWSDGNQATRQPTGIAWRPRQDSNLRRTV